MFPVLGGFATNKRATGDWGIFGFQYFDRGDHECLLVFSGRDFAEDDGFGPGID